MNILNKTTDVINNNIKNNGINELSNNIKNENNNVIKFAKIEKKKINKYDKRKTIFKRWFTR